MSQENVNNKMYYLIFALSIALALMAAALYAGSQGTAQQNTEHTIYMSGYAEQKVVPDTASLSIGVIIQADTAKAATSENAAIMNAVIKELKAMGLKDKDISTSYVSVNPVYNYDGEQTITGYSASNSVDVTTTMMGNISGIVDRSAAAGANQIGSISFSVSDEMQKELREELISEAVADALAKAKMLASDLDAKIIGVQSSSISDSSGSGIYYGMPEATMMSDQSSTPIQPGESTVSMSVQVTYLIE